jgi:hypothetical protein
MPKEVAKIFACGESWGPGKVDLLVILKSDFNYYYFASVRSGPFQDDIVTL